MFKLLQSIFGDAEKRGGEYPDHLVQAAIERAVDGTDPRIRLLPGYTKALRKPMLTAIDHVVALVAALPEPLPAGPQQLAEQPALAALFYSPDRLRDILGQSNRLLEYLETGSALRPIHTLMLADCHRKRGFGAAMVGEMLVQDEPRTTVTFENHRFIDPCDSREEALRHLRRRAFDYLLTIALRRIIARRTRRTELAEQRRLLQCKLDIMQRGGSGFGGQEHGEDRESLQAQLDAIEPELAALGPDDAVLKSNLRLLADVLADARQQLWLVDTELHLNHLNVEDPEAPAAHLQELHDAEGRVVTLLPVLLEPDQVPSRKGFLTGL